MIKAQDLSLANIKSVLLAGDVNTVMNRYTQLMLPVLVIIILAAIVLPLPAIILDLLLVTTIAIGIVILMISLYVPNALALASFPSILLFTTMLRLSLNVASTRMILGQGFAGEVIKAFGNFVVAGNFVVGFVIFVIITIIQFVVIAKGSERVSEVAARFTLDALPGKQMSIDADLRAGLMDPDTARTKRAALGQESQFYGAMDGAMKFVKGDTMAGILISLVNLVAGLGIGVAQKGLTFGEAAKKYTLLTVGDGLVSQIPSLIMSTAAAIITTRVASAGDEDVSLGEEIGTQILAQPKAIAIASGILAVFGLIPGLPLFPFLAMSAATGGIAYAVFKTQDIKDGEGGVRAEVGGGGGQGAGGADDKKDEGPKLPVAVPVLLETSPQITPLVDVQAQGSRFIQQLIPQMREWLFQELGVQIPGVRVRGNAAYLQKNTYVIYINEVPVGTGIVHPDRVFVESNLEQVVMMGLQGTQGPTPDGRGKGLWLLPDDIAKLSSMAVQPKRPDEYISVHLAYVLRRRIDQMLGIQEVQNMLNILENQGYSALVTSVVPDLVSVQRLTDILRRLLREDLSIRNMPAILEALAEWAPFENDPIYLTEYVRAGLKPYIAHKFGKGRPVMPVYLLDPRIEQIVRDGIRQSPSGNSLSLDPRISKAILEAFTNVLNAAGKQQDQPVILTQTDVRYFVKRMIDLQHSNAVVLSFQELPPELQIQPRGRIMAPPALTSGQAA